MSAIDELLENNAAHAHAFDVPTCRRPRPRARDGPRAAALRAPQRTCEEDLPLKAKARHAAKVTEQYRLYPYLCPRCGLWHLTHLEPPGIRPAA